MPDIKNQARDGKALFADFLGRGTAINQFLKVPLEMSPTDLSQMCLQSAVDRPAVTADDPLDVFAQQGLQSRSASFGMDDEISYSRGRGRPQPTSFACLFPAGFIDVFDRRLFSYVLPAGPDGGPMPLPKPQTFTAWERVWGPLGNRRPILDVPFQNTITMGQPQLELLQIPPHPSLRDLNPGANLQLLGLGK